MCANISMLFVPLFCCQPLLKFKKVKDFGVVTHNGRTPKTIRIDEHMNNEQNIHISAIRLSENARSPWRLSKIYFLAEKSEYLGSVSQSMMITRMKHWNTFKTLFILFY